MTVNGVRLVPDSALRSYTVYEAWRKETEYLTDENTSRVRAYLRESVIVSPDGTVRPRQDPVAEKALFLSLKQAGTRKYTAVHVPALALYATSVFEPRASDPRRNALADEFESIYGAFREKSKSRIKAQLQGVRVVQVPGSQNNFFLTSRRTVLKEMADFLMRP